MRILLLFMLAVAAGAATRQPAITASDAWVAEPTAAGQTTAAAYLTVNNPTMYDIYLVSATTDAAAKIEFREGEGTAVKAVKDITVPSFGYAELKAGGVFLMLSDLKRPLNAGDTISLTVTTDGGIALVIAAAVKKP